EDRLSPLLFHLVAQIEVDHVPAPDAQPVLADLEDLAGGDVAGDEVAVFRVSFLEKVVPLRIGDRIRRARVARLFRHPDPSPLAAGGFANEATLVLAGNGGGVDLDHLGVAHFGPG